MFIFALGTKEVPMNGKQEPTTKLFFSPWHEKLCHAFAKRYGRSAENLFWNEAPLIIQVIPVGFSATEFPFHRLDNRIPLLTVQDLLRVAANTIETNVPFLWQESL